MQMQTEMLKKFVDGVKAQGLGVRGIVVRQHGGIVDGHDIVEPVERIQLFSGSKTWTAMAVGIAMGEGYFKLSDRIIDLLGDEVPENVPAGYEKLTVWHLLTMSTGHSECPVWVAQSAAMEKYKREHGGEAPTPGQGNHMSDLWFDAFMTTPLAFDPDEHHFAYNNGASYMLSVITQRAVGMNIRDYLMPRVFAPLGIEDPVWDCDAKGRALGAIGLHLITEEFSRGGQLLLNGGLWQGRQLIPAEFVEEMTHRQVGTGTDNPDPEWCGGYGYQMWMCTYPQASRMDGMFGQFCILLPGLDAVVAITSHEEKSTGDILRLVWDTVTPALA